ncbi:MAG: hypothetical protein K0Q73_1234 [Paenibacillus sp.]|jgi:hypothetical protein|nr:hypothetical protein [Paenibacillus sp.]
MTNAGLHPPIPPYNHGIASLSDDPTAFIMEWGEL